MRSKPAQPLPRRQNSRLPRITAPPASFPLAGLVVSGHSLQREPSGHAPHRIAFGVQVPLALGAFGAAAAGGERDGLAVYADMGRAAAGLGHVHRKDAHEQDRMAPCSFSRLNIESPIVAAKSSGVWLEIRIVSRSML